jgi:hypothetical protein
VDGLQLTYIISRAPNPKILAIALGCSPSRGGSSTIVSAFPHSDANLVAKSSTFSLINSTLEILFLSAFLCPSWLDEVTSSTEYTFLNP